MKTRKTFDSVSGSSIRKLQGGMSLLAVFTLLSLGALGSGCGGSGPGGWYGSQCSKAVAGASEPGEDFSNCVLNAALLIGTDFSFADFDGAQLNNAKFWHPWYPYEFSTLIGTRFTNVEAQNVDFRFANLMQADFRPSFPGSTDLRWAVFDDANLYKANLNGANLEGAFFINAYLECADLSSADLESVNFVNANLTNADLSDSDLTNANFSGAFMAGANLNNAILTGVTLSSTQLGVIATTPPAPGSCP